MSTDDSCKEPETNLALKLGDTDQCVEKRFSRSFGAGANAGSAPDMTFVAANTLSELVWSPRKGLSIKCADGSFSEKKPSLLCDIGPSNMVSGLSTDMPDNYGKTIYEDQHRSTPVAVSKVGSDASGGNDSSRFHMFNAGDIIPLCSANDEQADETNTSMGIPLPYVTEHLKNTIADGLKHPGEPEQDVIQNGLDDEHIWRIRNSNDGNHMLEMRSVLAPDVYMVKECKREELPLLLERGNKDKTCSGFLEKWESTAENELQGPLSENACGSAKKIIESESPDEVGNSHCQNSELPCLDKIGALKSSPTHGRIQRYQMKGKAKALSNGDTSGIMFDNGENSYESVESCNSAGHGKRRWSENQFNLACKRVKKQSQEECPSSSSLVKRDNSFMNWVSNMMKGFSKSKENQEPSLPLALPDTNYQRESADHKTMGFWSIFQSLYLLNTKDQEQNTSATDFQTQGSEKLELNNDKCNINATPIACRTVSGNIYKRFPFPNQKFSEGLGTGPVTLWDAGPVNIIVGEEVNGNEAAENKGLCNLANNNKNGESSDSSHNIKVTDNIVDSEKTNDNAGCNGGPLTSLWVTRFTLKPLNQDICSKIDDGALNSVAGIGNSFGSFNTKSCEEKSLCNVNPILPSRRLKNPDAMASTFARRLDSLKHIMPSVEETDNSSISATLTCVFCGEKGHHFKDCLEITDIELEDLLRKANSYNGKEEEPCVCIRCFQHNHWAVACPNGSLRVRLKKEDARMGEDIDLNHKLKQAFSSSKMNLNAKLFDEIASSSREHKLKENQILPSSTDLVNRKISEVPKGIFDVVKRLRLSRTDIIKWMDSCMPLSHLDGFFLRLRLGKWEEGLGGTGYYVASITGVQLENSPRKPKKSISVNIGGIKCLVESQYISNHEFLEDELMAWWSATSTGGGKLPSEEDLRLKIKEKEMFRFLNT